MRKDKKERKKNIQRDKIKKEEKKKEKMKIKSVERKMLIGISTDKIYF